MAYTLQAIIFNAPLCDRAKHHGLSCVELGSGLCMIPLPYDYVEEHGIGFMTLMDEGNPTIKAELSVLCRSLSTGVKLAYVEAEFFGGDGTQACHLFEDTQEYSASLVDGEALNHALQWLGIKRDPERDEFDVVGLGRHRNTEDWLKK